jgi:hypothetical protein
MSKLRQLIRESINEYIREIDEAGNVAALEAKMGKTKEAIELREKKMNMDGLDEAYHDMLDKGKVKELANEVKALKKSLTKYEKQLEKLNKKADKSPKVEKEEGKEIVDEVSIDEDNIEKFDKLKSKASWNDKQRGLTWNSQEIDVDGALEETMEEDEERYDEEGNIDLNGMYDVGGNFIGPTDEARDKAEYDMNESFLHMQKLAGVISETEYKAKIEEAKKKSFSGLN